MSALVARRLVFASAWGSDDLSAVPGSWACRSSVIPALALRVVWAWVQRSERPWRAADPSVFSGCPSVSSDFPGFAARLYQPDSPIEMSDTLAGSMPAFRFATAVAELLGESAAAASMMFAAAGVALVEIVAFHMGSESLEAYGMTGRTCRMH